MNIPLLLHVSATHLTSFSEEVLFSLVVTVRFVLLIFRSTADFHRGRIFLRWSSYGIEILTPLSELA